MNAFTARVRRAALLAPAIVMALSIPAPAHAAGPISDVPPSPDIRIDPITTNGTGCRPDEAPARTEVDPDNGGFRAYFTDFEARAGAGVPPVESRKACQFNIHVSGAAGYRFALSTVDLRGFGELTAGAAGEQRTSAYFQGDSPTSWGHRFTRPFSDDWRFQDRIPVDAQIWSYCHTERNLNVLIDLRVTANRTDPASTALLSMTTWDDASAHVRLVWRTC